MMSRIVRLVGLAEVRLLAAGVLSVGVAPSVVAADQPGALEEVVVTAQRREQGVQEVPIAVTALSGQMLEDRQITQPTDLQMNSPNVSFTAKNFGAASLSIRGIGNLVTSGGGEPGVSIHLNDVAIPTNLPAAEFYDMERIEVLRGPQGTLFGRNATGGVLNMITKKPDFEEFGGHVDVEVGDYSHRRVKGALNVPVNDQFALRVSGLWTERNGYTENLAADQGVANIDDDIDGRDLYSYRITGQWNISDRATVWGLFSRFNEDDDKARITNQVCEQNDVPTTGCTPDGFGFEGVHPGSTTGGLFGGLFGAVPLGASNEAQGLNYEFDRPDEELGLRTMHADFEPVYEYQESIFSGGFDYVFDNYTLSLLGAYRDAEYLSRQDYNMDVGPTLNFPVPTSDVRGGVFDDECNLQQGNFGVAGGCVYSEAPRDRIFSYDQSSSKSRYYTAEAKLTSSYDGPLNFLLGANIAHNESSGDYFVVANTLDILTTAAGAYPGVFDTHSSGPGNKRDSYSFFGELYYDITPTVKLTAGLRYNNDEKHNSGASYLANAQNINFGTNREALYVRSDLTDYLGGAAVPDGSRAADLFAEYGVLEAARNASSSQERLGIARQVPIVPPAGESRSVFGTPSEAKFDEVTGRIGIDWQLSNTSMVYGFFTRGYKPGGFNPALNPDFQGGVPYTYDSEKIDSYEVGTKNQFFDGTMKVNATAFFYDYSGLQISRIQNNSAINDNIDAKIHGLELETAWTPLPRLALDMSYSYLKTDIDNGIALLDPAARTQGDSSLVLLKNIDSGSSTGTNYVVPRANLTDDVVAQALAAGAAFDPKGPNGQPIAREENGIPVYFSRNYLGAVGANPSEGVAAPLGGNELPNAPEHTVHLGAAYTWPLGLGSLTARWDYYWQGDSTARIYNRPGDEISSWDQHNASMIFESNDGRWVVKGWVRNIEDDNNVTGHYLTSDTSGLYRNYFLTDPRLYGASVRFAF